MAHKWVTRTVMKTMKDSESVSHLVQVEGILRAAPAICGSRVAMEEFWERAKKGARMCAACKSRLHRKQL